MIKGEVPQWASKGEWSLLTGRPDLLGRTAV